MVFRRKAKSSFRRPARTFSLENLEERRFLTANVALTGCDQVTISRDLSTEITVESLRTAEETRDKSSGVALADVAGNRVRSSSLTTGNEPSGSTENMSQPVFRFLGSNATGAEQGASTSAPQTPPLGTLLPLIVTQVSKSEANSIAATIGKQFHLGETIGTISSHREGGYVQHFSTGDVWVKDADSAEVYLDSGEGRLLGVARGVDGKWTENANDETPYNDTKFMNYRREYHHRPTLVVATPGMTSEGPGYNRFPWQDTLARNVSRELNIAGSQVQFMNVNWASTMDNSAAASQVAKHILEFVGQRDVQWNVMLVGHSRGAVFVSDVAASLDRGADVATFEGDVPASLGDRAHIRNVQLVLIDPTAAVSLGDVYPNAVPAGIARAIVYDDGYSLFPLNATKESQRIPGAEYKRVKMDGIGYYDTSGSHEKMTSWYASQQFQSDMTWLLRQDDVSNGGSFAFDEGAVLKEDEWKTDKPTDDRRFTFEFDRNRNGDFVAQLRAAGIGMASLTLGKSGLAVSYQTFAGGANFAITDRGLVIGYQNSVFGPASVGTQLVVSENETALDIDLGPIRLALFGKDSGIYLGGNKLGSAQSMASTADGSPSLSAMFNRQNLESIIQSITNGLADAMTKMTASMTDVRQLHDAMLDHLQQVAPEVAEQMNNTVFNYLKQCEDLPLRAADQVDSLLKSQLEGLPGRLTEQAKQLIAGLRERAQESVDSLNASVGDVNDRLTQEAHQVREQLDNAIGRVESKLSDAKSEIRSLEKQLDKSWDTLERVNDRIEGLKDDIKAWKHTINDWNDKIDDLRDRLTRWAPSWIKKDINRLKDKVNDYNDKISNALDKIDRYREEKADLKDGIAKFKKAIDKQRDRIDGYVSKIEELRANATEQLHQLTAQAESQIAAAMNAIEEAKTDLENGIDRVRGDLQAALSSVPDTLSLPIPSMVSMIEPVNNAWNETLHGMERVNQGIDFAI